MTGQSLLRPAMRLWYALQLTRNGQIPRPRTVPSIQTGAAPDDLVLLLGNGPTHGWGVTSHGLSMTGALARALGSRTGRATRVDYVGDELMDIAGTRAWIGDRDLGGHVAAAVIVGMNDAVRLTPPADYERHLSDVLDYLASALAPGARVAVSTIQRPQTVPVYRGPLGAIAACHALRLNEVTRRVALERPFVDLFDIGDPDSAEGRGFGSPAVYRRWAERVADVVAPALPAAAEPVDPLPADLEDVPQPGFGELLSPGRWSGLERAIELMSDGGMPALQRLTKLAKQRFHGDVATVTIVDGDRLWYIVPDGTPNAVPLQMTHCRVVAETGEPMLVTNSLNDERFRGVPLIELTHLRFYAGYPLTSSSGDVIGTFCMMGGFPRQEGALSMIEFGNLAKRAQIELWKLESEDGEQRDEDGRSVPASLV